MAANALLICFVCTGNYFRSPFAEAIFNFHAAQLGADFKWRATSRGLIAKELPSSVDTISPSTAKALAKRGIPLTMARSLPTQMTEEDYNTCTRVICASQIEHLPMVESQFPKRLPQTEFWDVEDVYGTADATPALNKMEKRVLALIRQLGRIPVREPSCIVL